MRFTKWNLSVLGVALGVQLCSDLDCANWTTVKLVKIREKGNSFKVQALLWMVSMHLWCPDTFVFVVLCLANYKTRNKLFGSLLETDYRQWITPSVQAKLNYWRSRIEAIRSVTLGIRSKNDLPPTAMGSQKLVWRSDSLTSEHFHCTRNRHFIVSLLQMFDNTCIGLLKQMTLCPEIK